ncbi:hypothetical protein QBC34DRAFT_477175 [Podospora aff. communis PSN243]|uniref:3-carboxymuconate cyclase n=1 Tax=Podospora aff. communis PSN243 TaxID=3040156 RepID=A0AAV9GXZ4_9PEZI|nr:hypothetical protein QBC34DRAFT_477175 [Podospora aff. communis PSN243]
MSFLFNLVVALLSLAPTVINALPQAASPPTPPFLRNARALYFITNNPQNEVIALQLSPSGLLTGFAASTSTSGNGSNGIDTATNLPAQPDALFSQSALTAIPSPDGNGTLIFAVNAQSNTLTLLSSPLNPPLTTTLLSVAPLPGTFPVTVSASPLRRTVCVGTTGSIAGLTCAPFTSTSLGAFDAIRPFDLNQTDPPSGPLNTVSHVFWSEDERRVMVSVKGDPEVNNTGFLVSFVAQGAGQGGQNGSCVGREGVVRSPEGTAVLFGAAPVKGSGGDVLVTDASFGAAVMGVDDAGEVLVKGRAEVEGQVATCWAAISPATGTGFVTDVARNRLVEVSVGGEVGVLGEISLTGNGGKGLIDLAAAGELVYALAPGDNETEATVTVVNVRTRKMVQLAKLGGIGVNGNAMGMALAF